jgi:hypothetical protein
LVPFDGSANVAEALRVAIEMAKVFTSSSCQLKELLNIRIWKSYLKGDDEQFVPATMPPISPYCTTLTDMVDFLKIYNQGVDYEKMES